jgi:hypothetical protein
MASAVKTSTAPVISGDGALVPLTLAFGVVACRLLSSLQDVRRLFAGSSPPSVVSGLVALRCGESAT